LRRNHLAFESDVDQVEKQIAARSAEMDVARDAYRRSKLLVGRGAMAQEQVFEDEGKHRVSQARLAEAQAAKRALQAKGTLEAESEVARREKELADAQAVLRLLEAGTRPEEVEAARARLASLQEELTHLEEQRRRQDVFSPISGMVITPRLREKVGQYLHEGDLICVVEARNGTEMEISLAEQDVARVRPGQPVRSKARALPFETFTTVVDRVAPSGVPGEAQSSVTVYCRLNDASDDLRTEMTGHARVDTGRRPIGAILLDRILRFVRTEFWW
jgi:HlyD family secretion protein